MKEDASVVFQTDADVQKTDEKDDISEDWDQDEMDLAFQISR